MREFGIFLIIIAVLMALTALKYRRQIRMAYQFWKQVKAAQAQLRENPPGSKKAVGNSRQLVNCARCGRWVPEDEALRYSQASFVCKVECALRKDEGSRREDPTGLTG